MSNYPNQGATGRFGRGSFKKPSFSKKPWEGGGGDDRPMKLHDATCASCGKSCEVPFIPNGKKPVYCRDCFANERGEGSNERSERPARREFSAPARPSYSQPENASQKPTNDALLKQVEIMNAKLEQLIVAVEGLVVKKPAKKVAVDK